MSLLKRILLMPVLALSITACSNTEVEPIVFVEITSVVDVASGNAEFSTLVSLLEATGLDRTLDATGSFTVFAPTNYAFAALGQDTLDALANDPDTLADILLYHVLESEVDSAAALGAVGTTVATANGDSIAITAGGTGVGVRINVSNVTAVDIGADNGIIHVIDRVLLPPEVTDRSGNSIYTIAKSTGDFRTLITALDAAGLDAVLNDIDSGAKYTVFAPTDDAFAALDADALSALIADLGALSEVLLQHVVADAEVDSVTAMSLAGTEVTTVSGNTVAVEIMDGMLQVGGATVIGTNIIASNGIIHVIDQVIIGDVVIPGTEPPGDNLGDEIAVNADFSSGLDDWIYTDGAVSVASEGDNSYAAAVVAEAGTAYSVNISQIVTLVPGETYVLSFDARASVARNIIAGIGLNYAPWYANVEVVAITTDWNSYELVLAAVDDGTGEEFGDPNNRIIFDLGAEVGNVDIDNVSLRQVITDTGGGPVSTPSLEGYTLVWSDEFDGASINTDNWGFQLGDGTEFGIPGWGNQELQIYTDSAENAAVGMDGDDSVLMITAREDGEGGYTSARLNSSNKVSARYGKIVGRMKLPETQGMWPAFWMLGDTNQVIWPGIGEIDIMELIGSRPNETFHTIHYVNGNQAYNFNSRTYTNSADFSAGYNEFMVDWTPEFITWYVNGVQAHQLPILDDMKEFQRSFHFLLNVAVGGTLPGNPDATTVFPQTMYVDYVRVYEKDGFVADPPPALDVNEETVGGATGEADINQAILTGFNDFGTGLALSRFGAGGEPSYSNSTDAIDGAESVQFAYPGGAFGGAWITNENAVDLTAYSASDLVFAIKKPAVVANLEVKLEGSDGSASSMFLVNYTATDLGNGWEEYRIPVADIVAEGLSLEQVSIPFALWNPVDSEGNFPAVDILFDAIRME